MLSLQVAGNAKRRSKNVCNEKFELLLSPCSENGLVYQYFSLNDFDDNHSLGSQMYSFFKRFLRDAEL